MRDMTPMGTHPFEAALARCGLAAGLTLEQLAGLARDLKPSAVTRLEGEVLCRTGETADRFWLVTSGSLRVSDQIEGESRGVQQRAAPALIGELALGRATSQRTATMTAQEHVSAFEVRYACLENIASAETRAILWRNLFTIACEKIAQSVPQRAAQSAAFASQEATLRRFVNPYALGQSRLGVREDYEEVEAIVWFSDLVGFSAFARGAQTRDVAGLIKKATSFVSDAIEAEGGHIDKFMGDGVMAWWIIPGQDVVHGQMAANAAFRAARATAAGLSAALGGTANLGIRIGLDHCRAHAGDFGSQARSNGLNTRTRGAEFVLTTSTDFGDMGSVQWSLIANYNETEVTKIKAPPAQLTGASLFDLTAIANLETTSPKYRLVAGGLWTWDRLAVNLKQSLYGPSSGYSSRTGCPLVTPILPTCYKTKIKAAVITDLEVSYKVIDAVKLTAGANNLFNVYPDRVNAFLRDEYLRNNSNAYVTQYPTFSPFGINGGYYYGKVTVTF